MDEINSKPIVMFDTSAINGLADETHTSAIIAGLELAFHVRVTATCFDEVVATSTPERRARLVNILKRASSGGDLILPYNWLLEAHIHTFKDNEKYDWQKVSVCPPGLQDFVGRLESITDELAADQLREAKALKEQFEQPFENIRDSLEEKLKAENYPFKNVNAFWQEMFKDGGAYWRIGGALMQVAFSAPPTESTVREFAKACPPFHALLLAYARREYEYSIAEKPIVKRKSLASRIDTYMASYLPYAAKFITNDEDQFNCYKAVTAELQLATEVFMYEDFFKPFLISA